MQACGGKRRDPGRTPFPFVADRKFGRFFRPPRLAAPGGGYPAGCGRPGIGFPAAAAASAGRRPKSRDDPWGGVRPAPANGSADCRAGVVRPLPRAAPPAEGGRPP
ncbi:hypothetical protein Misp01_43510 [Microtetraspora sp. NBRC 13810]|nr:hypothetical protein Misp01_43510 [Microtetraspora sp. NBRC 13810]